ncbi:MAG: HupE/UreJ family protein [Nevskiales bacterium]
MKRLLLLLLALQSAPLAAHELLSVSLHLDETGAGQVQAVLKTPLSREGRPVAVVPQFLQSMCRAQGETRVARLDDVILRQWQMHCAGGLTGQQLRMDGLDPRAPDAVITVRFAGGSQMTGVVDRHDPVLVLKPVTQSGPPPALMAYLPIGIEHILLGPDHLLFVLGLMLVVYAAGNGWRMLVASLTAFTLAHSITLVLATLGIWGLPPKPVEILIALSIVLLAFELATHQARRAQNLPPSLTLRKPWLVAFVFGLLHGFGFAGALAAVGLPEQARGWALFLFNLGVEVGQLIFVAVMLLVLMTLRRLSRSVLPANAAAVLVTLLGGVAAYWTLDRLLLWSAALWPGV